MDLLPLGAATQKRTAMRITMTTGRTMRQMVSSLRPAAPFKVWTVVDDASTKSGGNYMVLFFHLFLKNNRLIFDKTNDMFSIFPSIYTHKKV